VHVEWKEAFMALGGLAIAGLSWYVRGMVADLKELQTAIAAHRLHVSENYAKRTEFESLERKIDDGFQRMYDKIDEKADR